MNGVHYLPLTEVAAEIKARRISPVELTKAMLARIERLDPALESYVTVTADVALAQAEVAEAEIGKGLYRGPLHGVPIAVKDLCFTKGIKTGAGMTIHADFVPDYDSTVVTRFRAAGAVLLGKLRMTEGATLGHHPDLARPTNPWRPDVWAGVSSSGSGVAAAAGLCYTCLGSDTGGSVRYPSACNNLTGIKVTWGRVSRYGIFDLAASYDTIGPMARTAADVAATLQVVAGHDPHDLTSLRTPVPDYMAALAGVAGAKDVRIGLDPAFIGAGTGSVGLIEAAAKLLAEIGADVRGVTFPDPASVVGTSLFVIMAELASAHGATFPSQADRYGRWIREGLEGAYQRSAAELGDALTERDKWRGRMAAAFDEVDAYILPVFKGGAAPTWDEVEALAAESPDDLFRFTVPINAAGLPALTVPCGFAADGRPVAFQLVGPHRSEATLLKVAHAYQQATDWHTRHPALD